MRMFSAYEYRGKRMRMSASMKTENADSAQLWLLLDREKATVGFDSMGDRAVIETSALAAG